MERINTEVEDVLLHAGLVPEVATFEEFTMADRMLMIHKEIKTAGDHLRTWLNGRRG